MAGSKQWASPRARWSEWGKVRKTDRETEKKRAKKRSTDAREIERNREGERKCNEVLKERMPVKPLVYRMNEEREGKERVKPQSSSIADRQLYNMKTDGTGQEMTRWAGPVLPRQQRPSPGWRLEEFPTVLCKWGGVMTTTSTWPCMETFEPTRLCSDFGTESLTRSQKSHYRTNRPVLSVITTNDR